MSADRQPSTRGAINAADLAVAEDDLERAEQALWYALGKVKKERKLRGEST